MNEDLLQFIWKYSLWNATHAKTVKGEEIQVLKVGQHNPNEGPDFLQASLKIGNLTWNGPIEIHLKSSDWNKHAHESSPHYQNLIAHVVLEHDQEIPFFTSRNIPTLELKNRIPKEVLIRYQNLVQSPASIPCGSWLRNHADELPYEWMAENWVIEKWENSYYAIKEINDIKKGDWEATLWVRMAYALGLKVNSDIFEQISLDIPYSVIQKLSKKEEDLLALLHGKAGLLSEVRDDFQEELKAQYHYILHKYNLNNQVFYCKHLRLRPSAFPSIRLALLANIYHLFPHLFSEILEVDKLTSLKKLFDKVEAHSYFTNHYNYGKEARSYPKKLSDGLLRSLLINAIFPVQFAYFKSLGQDTSNLLELLAGLKKEKNSWLSEFEKLGFPHENALHSQGLIQLYKSKCSQKNCLLCSIGLQIIKHDS